MVSQLQLCQRAFVSLLLAVASIFSIQTRVNRDSHESDLRNAYEEVLAQVGRKRTAKDKVQELRRAKASWEEALVKKDAGGRPPSGGCRFQGLAVLLTYQSLQDKSHWQRFTDYVKKQLKTWHVKYWCATLETCKTGRLHAHLMLQFHHSKNRSSAAFRFDGIPPNVKLTWLLARGRGPPQSSSEHWPWLFLRLCQQDWHRAGWLWPGLRWRQLHASMGSLWMAMPLTKCKASGRKLFGSITSWMIQCMKDTCSSPGMACRRASANLDACKTWRETQEEQSEIDAVVKRIRSNPAVYQPFPEVPQVSAWLRVFKTDCLPYPLLIILGPSASGKTEFAKSLFQSPLDPGAQSWWHWGLPSKDGGVQTKTSTMPWSWMMFVTWASSSPIKKKLQREVRQQDRICDHTGWHMLLHEVSFQDPHCRDCQLHHAALGFFAQQRLAQQTPEHSVAEVATACMRMVLALKCQCLAPPLYSQWPCMFPEQNCCRCVVPCQVFPLVQFHAPSVKVMLVEHHKM